METMLFESRDMEILEESRKYCEYGRDYNRHIATTAGTIRSCMSRGFSYEQLSSLFRELEMRMDFWVWGKKI